MKLLPRDEARERMRHIVRALTDTQLKTTHREMSLQLMKMKDLPYAGDKRALSISCLTVESEALRRDIQLPYRSDY